MTESATMLLSWQWVMQVKLARFDGGPNEPANSSVGTTRPSKVCFVRLGQSLRCGILPLVWAPGEGERIGRCGLGQVEEH
jgi:hypothetical protein